MFSVVSLLVGIFYSILLYIQIKKYGCRSWRSLFKKVKTWVFISIILLLLFIFYANLFVPTAIKWAWYVFI